MKHLVKVIVLFLVLLTLNGGAEESEDLSRWFTYYYIRPEPASVPEAIVTMSRAGWLESESSLPPIFGFLAGVFRKNPEKIPTWIKRMERMKKEDFIVVILGLWYANLPDSKERVYALLEHYPVLKRELEFLYRGDPAPLEEIPLEQGPWVLDALWGEFMATGERAPVLRIIKALAWVGEEKDVYRKILGSAARWSLLSNAIQHRRVLEICRSQVASRPEPIASVLREIISKAEKEPGGRSTKGGADSP